MSPEQRSIVIAAVSHARGPIAGFMMGVKAIFDPKDPFRTALKGGMVRASSSAIVDGENVPYVLELDPSFSYLDDNKRLSLVYTSMIFGAALLHLGDAIAELQCGWPKRAEFQFLKQCRNAIAHGNRIHVHQGALPAAFMHYSITHAKNGQRLFMDLGGDGLLMPGDALHLLDAIEKIMQNGVEGD